MHAKSVRLIAVCAVFLSVCFAPAWSQDGAAAPVQQNAKPAKNALKKKTVRPDSAVTAQPAFAADTAAAKADSSAAQVMVSNIVALKVVTVPESAAVYLDDSLRGASPCTIEGLLPGPHVLTLKKKGFYLKKAEITVDTVPVQELSFTLLQPAFLRVESAPAGAAVSLDGKKEGASPWETDKMKPGDHALKVELADHVPFAKTISVQSNGRDTVRITLDRTQAYKDSVAAAALVAEKSRRERFIFALVSALFSVCAIALVVFEASSGE